MDATHDFFLDAQDRAAIDSEVSAFLLQVTLHLAVNGDDAPFGFMILHDGHMETLFVDPDRHGEGISRSLLLTALADVPDLTTDVNEQNLSAVSGRTQECRHGLFHGLGALYRNHVSLAFEDRGRDVRHPDTNLNHRLREELIATSPDEEGGCLSGD